MASPEPRRKATRLPQLCYLGANCYFITICCHRRANFLADAALMCSLEIGLREACETHRFNPYAYCFMPNHFHGLLVGMSQSANLVAVVRRFKGNSTARARSLGIARLWQKGFYDHVIRTEESLNRIAWYILTNPVRSGLVRAASDWRFSHWAVSDWRTKLAPEGTYVPPWKSGDTRLSSETVGAGLPRP